jgi:hypothetical protein
MSIQLVPIVGFVWLAWLLSPFGTPFVLPSLAPAVRFLSVCFALSAIIFIGLYVFWLLRTLLIYRLNKLVRDQAGSDGYVALTMPDGRTCSIFPNEDGISLTLDGGIDSWTYRISPGSMFAIKREQELMLDETNSPHGLVMRWLSVEKTSYEAVNQWKAAREIRHLIDEQHRS